MVFYLVRMMVFYLVCMMVFYLVCMMGIYFVLIGGRNAGRVGTLTNVERHDGSFSIVTVKDSKGNTFATRLGNLFVIGSGTKPEVSLSKGKGIKKTILQERAEAEARGDL